MLPPERTAGRPDSTLVAQAQTGVSPTGADCLHPQGASHRDNAAEPVATDVGIVRALMFTCRERAAVGALSAALGEHGIGVTRSAEPDECIELLGACNWHFLIVDAGDETHSALGVLARSRQVYPDVPAVVLVKHGDTRTAVRAMKAGAADCLETPIEPTQLLSAVTSACRPASHTSLDGWTRLTRVERTVLGHILEGRTSPQIAERLCRSPRTVEVHRRHIMTKLGVTNLVGLVKRSLQIEEPTRTANR